MMPTNNRVCGSGRKRERVGTIMVLVPKPVRVPMVEENKVRSNNNIVTCVP
jgi:hypothetical protein